MARRTLTSLIEEALSQGITDAAAIKSYLRKRKANCSDTLVSLVKSGNNNKGRRLTIPYKDFNEGKHLDSFFNCLEAIQEWVDDDREFVGLLKAYIAVVEDMMAHGT